MMTPLEETTIRFWKASLAWKNIGEWAEGWTQGEFIKEVRAVCCSPYYVGQRADDLLEDMIHNKELSPLGEGLEATVVSLPIRARPESLVK